MRNYFIIITLFLLLGQLNAQIVTDRPDQTESSSTVGLGNLQIESGFLVGFEGESAVRQLLIPTTLFRYGITEGIELRLLSQYESLHHNGSTLQGISDIEIGTKIEILKEQENSLEIAFLSHLIVPSGSRSFTGNTYGTINKLSIAHAINDNVSIGYNVGYNYFDEDNRDLTYSVALGIGVNNKVGIYIEPYGEIVNLEDFILNVDAGFTYLVNDDLQLDFSFGTGVQQRMNYISTGVSWLIHKK